MGVLSTQGIQFQLVANDTILDLFKDEDILLSDNVTGLFDLGIIPADFTRQITLPGTKKNNDFFEHVYDISIESPDTFATNIKVPAYLDFGGIYLSQGYLQLNKVNVYANKFIDSYEVTIFGAVSSFAREINRSYLTDLTSLSAYNHTSSYSNISSSWTQDLFGGAIVYPLAEYGQRLQYTSGDLFFGIDDNEGALGVQDFKPAIKAKIVLDAIFNEAGYTYSSSFIDNGGLDFIYLVCNRALRYPVYSDINLETYGQILISPISASGQTDLVVSQTTNTILPWYNIQKDPSSRLVNGLAYDLTTPSSLRGNLTLNVKISGSLGGPQINLRILQTGSLTSVSDTTLVNFNSFFIANTTAMFAEGANGQNKTYEIATQFNTATLPVGSYYFALYWDDIYSSPYNNFTFTLDPDGKPKSKLEITKVLNAADDRVMDIPLNMPFGTSGIKQIDFITSIQKKYNLVIYPSKTVRNEFIIEPFTSWYNKGRRWDFNNYANLNDKIEVIPANNLAVNELTFGDTLDQDYISQQFSKEANREFGKSYYVDLENFFSQGKFEVKTSIASTQLLQIPGTGVSGSVEGLNPTPSITFAGDYGVSTSSNPRILCGGSFNYTGIYSSTGLIEPSAVLYFDSAGTLPLLGYRGLFDVGSCEIWTIDPSTAIVQGSLGTCTDNGQPCP
jgi:hypothetical protein